MTLCCICVCVCMRERARESEREKGRKRARGQRVCRGNVINQLQLEKCSTELKKPDDSCVCMCEKERKERGAAVEGRWWGVKWETDLGFLLKRLPKPHHSKACVGANLELS